MDRCSLCNKEDWGFCLYPIGEAPYADWLHICLECYEYNNCSDGKYKPDLSYAGKFKNGTFTCSHGYKFKTDVYYLNGKIIFGWVLNGKLWWRKVLDWFGFSSPEHGDNP